MNIPGSDYADQRKSALIAGTALMIMTLAAAFSYGFVHASLLVSGDAAATFRNIMSHNPLFKAEILGWIVIMACDIMVAWACYVFLKPINDHLALLGAWLRLTYSAILGMAMMNLLWVQQLATGADELTGFTFNQLGEQALLHLKSFESVWSVGLMIFGGHLLILGLLTLRSKRVPKWIGILLLVASAGYVLTHSFALFFAEYEAIRKALDLIFTLPMTVGELGFGLWMLIRGGKKPLAGYPANSDPGKLSS